MLILANDTAAKPAWVEIDYLTTIGPKVIMGKFCSSTSGQISRLLLYYSGYFDEMCFGFVVNYFILSMGLYLLYENCF